MSTGTMNMLKWVWASPSWIWNSIPGPWKWAIFGMTMSWPFAAGAGHLAYVSFERGHLAESMIFLAATVAFGAGMPVLLFRFDKTTSNFPEQEQE